MGERALHLLDGDGCVGDWDLVLRAVGELDVVVEAVEDEVEDVDD